MVNVIATVSIIISSVAVVIALLALREALRK